MRDDVDGGFAFRCSRCGQDHVGMPSFGWDWPVQYLTVEESERDRRVELAPDHCIIDGRWFFVRGCLELRVQGRDEPFSWGAWVSLSEQSFDRYAALRGNTEREAGARFVGWLCSLVPGYPDTQNLKAALHVRSWPTRPFIELEPTDHPLAVEQRCGITPERVRELAEVAMHPRHDDRTGMRP